MGRCPTCRSPLDADRPIRALGVEQAIGTLPCTCPHGCGLRTTRGEMAAHEAACPSRRATCPGTPHGCVWRGLASELAAHASSCVPATVSTAVGKAVAPLQARIDELAREVTALRYEISTYQETAYHQVS